MARVLALEPYYGGSHRAFLDQWAKRSRHDFRLLTLPPGKWKWRMRHSAISFARSLEDVEADSVDLVWCSDMVNLAELAGLLAATSEKWAAVPTVTYFHENQLTYPVQAEQERDFHFGLTNLTTALASTEVWFNSDYHRSELLGAVEPFLRRMPDHRPPDLATRIAERSRVEPPGVEDPRREEAPADPRVTRPHSGGDRAPLIAWVGRWEHDKAPEVFFAALDAVAERGLDFRLAVLGERFPRVPSIFAEARDRHRSRILQWGFVESRSRYFELLCEADIVVSTARHEFFGLAIVEAILAGAHPLVPRRLSYPELLAGADDSQRFFFDSARGLVDGLVELLVEHRSGRLRRGAARRHVSRFLWSRRGAALDRAVGDVVRGGHSTAATSDVAP